MKSWAVIIAIWSGLLISAASLVITPLVWITGGSDYHWVSESGIDFTSLLDALMGLAMCIVGALVIHKLPRQAVGWTILTVGSGLGLAGFTASCAEISLSRATSVLPGYAWMAWLSQVSWSVIFLGMLVLLLVFPTGQFLTTRWRLVGWIGFLINTITWLLLAIADPIEIGSHRVANPIGAIPVENTLPYVSALFILFLFSLGAALVSLFLRFMRANDRERRQIKWILYVAAIFVIAMLYSFIGQSKVGAVLVGLSALGFPFAIGISILRYRLFDIDLIIRRTLQYALLSALLALLYFGIVTVLQGVFTTLGGSQSTAATVISTLAIAALFNPLRRRLQLVINHSFYRKQYDAEHPLAQFAAIARQEVEIDKLSTSLLTMVQEAVQPEDIRLWLKKAGSEKPA